MIESLKTVFYTFFNMTYGNSFFTIVFSKCIAV